MPIASLAKDVSYGAAEHEEAFRELQGHRLNAVLLHPPDRFMDLHCHAPEVRQASRNKPGRGIQKANSKQPNRMDTWMDG